MTVTRVFLTGGGGFVGARTIARLVEAGCDVVALDRSGRIPAETSSHLNVVRGDVLSPESYRTALSGCDVVLHLAASTGRASAAEHFRINLDGTRTLLNESRTAGVRRFLFVSSIAAGFPDLRGYAYGQAKLQAEAVVRNSGIPHAILRPTMIFGEGSPLQAALTKLATLPAIVLPGTGRARVQPVHVNDVARALVTAVTGNRFANQTFDIGGPDVVTMETLLRSLRNEARGASGPLVRIPLWMMQPPLRLAEAAGLLRFLPISAGQLSSFRFDGVVGPNDLQACLDDGTLSQVVTTSAGADAAVSVLEQECLVLARYLLDVTADDAIRRHYVEAHRLLPSLHPANRFDAFLTALGSRGVLSAKLADSYAAFFAPGSTLRKKLVLVLAILESSPDVHRTLDEPAARSRAWFFVSALGRGLTFVAALAAATVILLPAQILLSRREAGRA